MKYEKNNIYINSNSMGIWDNNSSIQQPISNLDSFIKKSRNKNEFYISPY